MRRARVLLILSYNTTTGTKHQVLLYQARIYAIYMERQTVVASSAVSVSTVSTKRRENATCTRNGAEKKERGGAHKGVTTAVQSAAVVPL